MSHVCSLVVFTLDEGRYGLRLPAVERVVRVAEIAPLPKAPGIVLGVVNVQGRIIPVFDVRRRFRLPVRETTLNDHLILARTTARVVALQADAVLGLVEQPAANVTEAGAILPGLDYLEGVAKLDDGLVFIHNLDTFLALDEARTLEAALATTGGEA